MALCCSQCVCDCEVANFAEQVHEAGHNMAKSHIHGTGDFEYTQIGLSSNEDGKVHPTSKNTKEIIKDETNRQTLKK